MIQTSNICLLKTEVQKRFGRTILSSADCLGLCDDISRNSGVKISFNTIRRYFNLMKASNQPSFYTLNTLSVYCGFSSFDNFVKAKQQSLLIAPSKHDNIALSFLTLFFKQIEVSKKNDLTYLSFVQQTILHLDHYPSIIDVFQREIARTRNGQVFYFEQFVFVDKLNSYYGNGLQYYMNEKKTAEAHLFGHSLLCYRGWLTNNREMLEIHYNRIKSHAVNKNSSPSVCARYFAAQMFYADIFKQPKDEIHAKARKAYLSMSAVEENPSDFNRFEVILAEALVLTGCFEEASFYIEEVLTKVKKNQPAYIGVALFESISVLKTIVLAHTRKKMNAAAILHDINPSSFFFLSRNLMSILYLLNKRFINHRFFEQQQLDYLIEETGFVNLLSICDPGTPVSNIQEHPV